MQLSLLLKSASPKGEINGNFLKIVTIDMIASNFQ